MQVSLSPEPFSLKPVSSVLSSWWIICKLKCLSTDEEYQVTEMSLRSLTYCLQVSTLLDIPVPDIKK